MDTVFSLVGHTYVIALCQDIRPSNLQSKLLMYGTYMQHTNWVSVNHFYDVVVEKMISLPWGHDVH